MFYSPRFNNILVPLASIFLAACQNIPLYNAQSNIPIALNGIWQSDGYGYIIDNSERPTRLFHHTEEVCIEDRPTAEILRRHYLNSSNLSFSDDLHTMMFSTNLETHRLRFEKIEILPIGCGAITQSDPHSVFDALASYMKTHYAFFDLYNIDWEQRTKAARNNINPLMGDEELFEILSELLSPLKDNHVTLTSTFSGEERTFNPSQSSIDNALNRIASATNTSPKKTLNKMLHQYWFNDIKTEILEDSGEISGNEYIQYGVIANDIGYMAFATQAGYSRGAEGYENQDLLILNKTLDRAINEFNSKQVKSIIIDLSINFGGHDFIAREIASRFTNERRLSYTKFAADAKKQKETLLYIEPTSNIRYQGPIYVVTTDMTVSAGEILTMALRTLPQTIHVGEATRGAQSDSLTKLLPNGWTLGLSNEVYHDHLGNFWEGKGIQPNIDIQIFNKEDPFNGHLEAIRRVINLIQAKLLSDSLGSSARREYKDTHNEYYNLVAAVDEKHLLACQCLSQY